MKYWIETYGCQMNKAESNALETTLQSHGWSEALDVEASDLVIINTCSVRKTAESRIWGRLGFFKSLKAKKPFTLVVTGCMAERMKDELIAEAPVIDLVIGTFQKESFAELIAAATAGLSSELPASGDEYHFASRHYRAGEKQAFVPIMHGCNNFCTYCIVPYVRGREKSRNPEDILNELKAFSLGGGLEVTLLGQNVNSYHYQDDDRKMTFAGLLQYLADGLEGSIPWIRFLTSHPKDLSDDVLSVMASHPELCRHIHLPVQHGSNRILDAMNRKYTRESYLELVRKVKTILPGVALSSDILIGFPGETLDDLEDTISLMQTVSFDDAFTYYYNAREGTKAASFPDALSEEEKLSRLSRVIEVQRGISEKQKRTRLHQTLPVLVESVSRKSGDELLGRTQYNDMVVFPGSADLVGRFTTVRLEVLAGNTFRGVEVQQ